MTVTDVRITKADKGAIKAWGSITLNDEFVIHGIRVIETEDKKFVAMPSRRTKDGNHLDICHPINENLREIICKAVFKEYDKLTAEVPNS